MPKVSFNTHVNLIQEVSQCWKTKQKYFILVQAKHLKAGSPRKLGLCDCTASPSVSQITSQPQTCFSQILYRHDIPSKAEWAQSSRNWQLSRNKGTYTSAPTREALPSELSSSLQFAPPGQLLIWASSNPCYHCPAVIWGEVREAKVAGGEGITGEMEGAGVEGWAKSWQARIQIQAASIH